MPPLILVQPDLKKRLVGKVGLFTIEEEMIRTRPDMAAHVVAERMAQFIRDMEKRGYEYYRDLAPQLVMADEQHPFATYTLDWEDSCTTQRTTDGKDVELAKMAPINLEQSKGKIDLRVVAIFIAPETTVEVVTYKNEEELPNVSQAI